MWGNQLNNRSPAEKMGVRGKLACATYTHTHTHTHTQTHTSAPEALAQKIENKNPTRGHFRQSHRNYKIHAGQRLYSGIWSAYL